MTKKVKAAPVEIIIETCASPTCGHQVSRHDESGACDVKNCECKQLIAKDK